MWGRKAGGMRFTRAPFRAKAHILLHHSREIKKKVAWRADVREEGSRDALDPVAFPAVPPERPRGRRNLRDAKH